MTLTPEQLRELRSKVAFWSELKRKDAISLFDHINAQHARIAELEQDAARLREFVTKVAQQTPEKPDYWSSCGQCERNASEAEDLIAAAPETWPEDISDYGSRIAVIGQNGEAKP